MLFALVAEAAAAADDTLARAYAELRNHNYELAIVLFRNAIEIEPKAPAIRKDLAYTLLKVGETESARDQFQAAMNLDPVDHHVALEYAFLAYETRERRVARLVFDRIRRAPPSESQRTAARVFENIERDLRAGLARWRKAVELTPDRFSVHQELARLAEEHDELDLAARHYLRCFQLRPDMREFLVDLGRVHQLAGRSEEAIPALLAASRGAEPRIAERALELLPPRYPFVYEFQQALAIDRANVALRRELAFLHLKMHNEADAIVELEKIRDQDKLAAEQLALLRPKAAVVDPRELAEKSYRAGFMNDALKYYRIALESTPQDEQLMLRLGWTLNVLKRDDEALEYFKRARQSANPAIAQEANKAYRNLRPNYAPVRTTVWLFPFYSTRWSSGFSYGQAKAEFRLGNLPIRPYVSLRLVGDIGAPAGPALSERAVIPAAGVALSLKRVLVWGEAGREVRAGISHGKGWGRLLGAGETSGAFVTANQDAVYLGRFEGNTLAYLQNRAGYTWRGIAQLHWNFNATFDTRRLWWGNFVETGPGIRVRIPGAPRGLVLSADLVRGQHLVRTGIPRSPNYLDLRAGFWYAFTY